MLRPNPPRSGYSSGVPSVGDEEAPQLVAVAVDCDKNSQHALKWAADHLLPRGVVFVLLHVKRKVPSVAYPSTPLSLVDEDASCLSEQMDSQTQEILVPFQCFCSRRGLNSKDVILESMNISKAIVDFVLQYGVDKLVLGASSRNAFSRTFKQTDVPSAISRIAPEFCSIYIVSKGKLSSSRPATRPKTYNFSGLSNESGAAGNQLQSNKSEMAARHLTDSPRRFALVNTAKSGYGSKHIVHNGYDQRDHERVSHYEDPHEISFPSSSSCPSPMRPTIDKKSNYLPRVSPDRGLPQPRFPGPSRNEPIHQEEQRESFEYHKSVASSSGYTHSSSLDEAESEMRRLKLELRMVVDKYEDAARKTSCINFNDDSTIRDPLADRGRTVEMIGKEQRWNGQTTERSVELSSGRTTDRQNLLLQDKGDKFSSDAHYRKYSIEEIKNITDNFSPSLKIGEGGYGPVFRTIVGHSPVAIKIPHPNVARGMEQFQQEVDVLGSIRHPNLVNLIGACPEFGCLVYEFMANGNLEDCIFCRSGRRPLSWQLRFKIAADVASALLFLHQTKPEPLVHRDLKPANILLDGSFVGKISDVGLARLIPSSTSTCSSQYLATAAAGTFCYIDPEYQQTGTVGVKSDVYALGIILLQLVTAQEPVGLAHRVEIAMERGSFEEMLDPKVPDWPIEETVRLAKMALVCAELRRRDRPDLASVVLPELNQLRKLADLSLGIGGRH